MLFVLCYLCVVFVFVNKIYHRGTFVLVVWKEDSIVVGIAVAFVSDPVPIVVRLRKVYLSSRVSAHYSITKLWPNCEQIVIKFLSNCYQIVIKLWSKDILFQRFLFIIPAPNCKFSVTWPELGLSIQLSFWHTLHEKMSRKKTNYTW